MYSNGIDQLNAFDSNRQEQHRENRNRSAIAFGSIRTRLDHCFCRWRHWARRDISNHGHIREHNDTRPGSRRARGRLCKRDVACFEPQHVSGPQHGRHCDRRTARTARSRCSAGRATQSFDCRVRQRLGYAKRQAASSIIALNDKEPIMDDLAPLEDFSALDDWLPEAEPLWLPFRPAAAREESVVELEN